MSKVRKFEVNQIMSLEEIKAWGGINRHKGYYQKKMWDSIGQKVFHEINLQEEPAEMNISMQYQEFLDSPEDGDLMMVITGEVILEAEK